MTDFSTTDLPVSPNLHKQPASPEPLNPFLYEEFAGPQDNVYLDSIVQQILPIALWRTWRWVVRFHHPGQPLVVSVAEIATQAGRHPRKIYLDLQALETRQLLTTTSTKVRSVQEDGTVVTRTMHVRDFSGLYALAYEYHLWLHDPHFLPAERRYVSSLKANPTLLHTLVRFEPYRHVLLCKKPGRKPALGVATHEGEREERCSDPAESRTSASSITSHR